VACTAAQLELGAPTAANGFGTLGTTSMFVTQPIHNTGGACRLEVPASIGLAPSSGSFRSVAPENGGTTSGIDLAAGGSASIVVGAWWPAGGQVSPPPCADAIRNVTRAEVPLASGHITIELPTTFVEACLSPVRVSLGLEP
jgi:hypothetical protein